MGIGWLRDTCREMTGKVVLLVCGVLFLAGCSTQADEIKWMLMPREDGDVQLAILSGIQPATLPDAFIIRFLLYTRDNPTTAETRSMNPNCLPVFKNFNAQRPTKILVHGFGDSSSSSIMYPLLRDAFLAREDLNVFVVDWSELAATPWYSSAASNTLPVARHTASLIDHLTMSTGAKIEDFHLIGFSLGAHVVGITGQYVKTGPIAKITALDPAQVLFTDSQPDQRLDTTDASLVEVVHTSGGYLGYIMPLGHRDFFPNGGTWPQPGCIMDIVAVCSHRRAYYYYAEALRDSRAFPSFSCATSEEYDAYNCSEPVTYLLSEEDKTPGIFYFHTNSVEPFAQGFPAAIQAR